MKRVLLVLLLLLVLLWSDGFAGTISEPYGGGYELGIQLQPLGQSFTADAPCLMSATFWFQDYSYGPNMFTYRLLAGAGTNGPVLASTSFLIPFTPPDGFYGSATATFDSVPLTVGQQYTLLISATNIHCLVGAVDTSVPAFPNYAGGTAIISGIIQPQIDLGFVIQTVPEPNAAALLVCGAGVGILIWARKNLRPCRRAGEELRIADSRQRRPE